MKISLILKKNPFFSSSASGNRALTLIEGLRDLGCQIELIITSGYHNKSEKKQLGKAGKYNGVNYKYFNHSVLNTLWKRRIYKYLKGPICRYFVAQSVKQYLASEKTILWPTKDIAIWQIIYEIKKRHPKYPLFIELSEFLDIHRLNRGNILHRKAGDITAKFFERKFFPLIDGFALMTNTLMDHFSKIRGNNPKMIHLPMTVDLKRFSGQPEGLEGFTQPYIAFVGVMNDNKDGVSNLIKAFNNIKEKYPNHKVYLVGAWNYDTPTHLKLIDSLQLKEKVFWMKAYSRDQIPNIICNAELLVLPRPDSRQAQGGFPTKLGEYLATGKPVCATTVGEIPDYLIDNESVFFAEPGSVESFAKAMHRALQDPENAKRVGENGRKIAEKAFNKDIQSKKLYDFLMTLWER